jgi:hypothetical protein
MKKAVFLIFLVISMSYCIIRQQTITMITTGNSNLINTAEMKYHTFYITTSGVSTNIVFRVEGSGDNTNWSNLDDNNINQTITNNTTILYHKDNFFTSLARINWISKSGVGTTPNILIQYTGGY